MTSNQPRWNELRLGIFFLVSTVVLVTSLFIVGTNQHLFRRKYDLHLHVQNAQGLATGGLIALSGIEVGRVTGIEFVDSDSVQAIDIVLSIERRFQRRITRSSVATVRTVGVLGDKFVDISLGEPDEPPLVPGSRIPVRGTVDWAQTFERGVELLDDLAGVLEEARSTFAAINSGEGALGELLHDDDLAKNLGELTANLNAVSANLRRGNGTLSRLLTEPTAADKVDRILDRVDRIAAETEEGSGLLTRVLFDSTLADRVDALVANSDSLVNAVRHEGTTGALLSDDELYRQLETAIRDLKTLMTDIRENPERYVRVSIF